MKRIAMIITAVVMAVLFAATLPAQVFADSLPEYISEVKIGMGKDGKTAKAALEGYKILSDGKGNPVDLNQSAGGGSASKGEKVVYLGYKVTTDREEAVTDLALMNMKGGYSVQDYEALMESQLKSQIIPFVDNFLAAIKEYRSNMNHATDENRARAQFVRAALNKLIDDDTGKGLGDLLLNETKYEMGLKAYNKLSKAEKEKTDVIKESDKAYNALPDEKKANTADILTILAQSNGEATVAFENLIVRASDDKAQSWIERLADISYDDLREMYANELGVLPSEAEAELDRLYEDDAKKLLSLIDSFKEEMESYDEALENFSSAEDIDFEGMADTIESFDPDKAGPEEFAEFTDTYYEYADKQIELMEDGATVAVRAYLAEYYHCDENLLDFFTRDFEDLTELYPVIESLSKGQRAGLEFVSLKDLVLMAEVDKDAFDIEKLADTESESIYKNVDRDIYKKGGVALTSDALRSDAALKAENPSSFTPGLAATLLYAMGGVSLIGFIGTAITKVRIPKAIQNVQKAYTARFNRITEYFKWDIKVEGDAITWIGKAPKTEIGQSYKTMFDDQMKMLQNYKNQKAALVNRSAMCNKLMVGLTVAMVILTAVATYLTYKDMVDYYKVDFTPIPHYMVDEKDITAFNENGEKIVLKNQTAYYKAVECNRTEKDEFYKTVGTCADMNGDVGRQWLALYARKSDAEAPILANSLIAKVKDKNIPAGYKTGIHMFGSGSAFNLNSELYDWNKSAPSVMVYFKVDTAAEKPAPTASTFTAGNLALAGVAGLAVGAVVTALASKAVCRKKKETA